MRRARAILDEEGVPDLAKNTIRLFVNEITDSIFSEEWKVITDMEVNELAKRLIQVEKQRAKERVNGQVEITAPPRLFLPPGAREA